MEPINEKNEQKITYARASLWAPFYAVGMVGRIQGYVPAELLKAALRKLQILYPPLASRVHVKQDGTAWLTTEGVGEFSLEVRPMTSECDWSRLFLEQERLPFPFEQGPVARFYLLQGKKSSDLVAIAPHVVCDGYSMTQVMTDAVALLNDPEQVVNPPSAPPQVTWKTVSHSALDDILLRGCARIANRVWPDSRAVLRQDDYEELHRCYWARQQNGLQVFGLSRAETSKLVARCKQHGVTITGGLVAAFLMAQNDCQQPSLTKRFGISVAVNIRDRMVQSPCRVVGVYASSIDLTLGIKSGDNFWKLASNVYSRIHMALKNRSRIFRPLVLDELDPTIADKLVVAVSKDQWHGGVRLLAPFIKFKGDIRCLDVSNIGRVDLPDVGASYCLVNLLPFPPLVPGGGIALNILTVDGQMNITIKYRKDRLDDFAASMLKDRAFRYLSVSLN